MLGPRPAREPMRSSCGWARCRRRSDRSVASSPGRVRSASCSRTGPARTSSRRRSTPADAAAALAALRVVRSAEGRAVCGTGSAATSTSVAPGHPSPIVPVIIGAGGGGARGGSHAPGPGPVGAGHPPARPWLPAAAGCGSPCPPPTPTSRSRRLTAALAELGLVAAVTAAPVRAPGRRHRHRGRQDLGGGRDWPVSCGPRAATVRAHKPAQSFEPDAGPTDADVLAAATGQRPDDVCPPHRWYETPDGAADGRRGAGMPALQRSPTSSARSRCAGRRRRACSSRARAGCGRRSPPTATPSTWRRRSSPTVVLLVADAALGTINAVRLVGSALGAGAGRRVPEPLRCRPTTSTGATGPGWPTDAASRSRRT